MDTSKLTVKRRSQKDYSLAFKLSLVEQVEKGQYTYKEIQNKYGIQGRSTVLVWLRKHGTLDWSSKRDIPMTKETPEQKIIRLEKALQDKSDYAYLLEETIKRVDREVGSDFRKKFLSSLPKRLKIKDK
jgi:transposase